MVEEDADQRTAIPDFWVDPSEFTVAEYRRIQERGLPPAEAKRQTDNRSQNKPDDFAMGWMSFDEALQRAEDSEAACSTNGSTTTSHRTGERLDTPGETPPSIK